MGSIRVKHGSILVNGSVSRNCNSETRRSPQEAGRLSRSSNRSVDCAFMMWKIAL